MIYYRIILVLLTYRFCQQIFKRWLYRGACAFSTAFALIGAWTGMDIPIQLNDMKGTFATTEPGTVPWQLTFFIEEFFHGFQIFFFGGG